MTGQGSDRARPSQEVPRVLNVRRDPKDHEPAEHEMAAALPAVGSSSRVVRVGSLSFRLDGLDARLAKLVDHGYRGFASDEACETTSRIAIVRSPRASYLYLPRDVGGTEEARVGARTTSQGLDIWSYFFAARFAADGSDAKLLLCDVADLDAAQAIENTLRFVVSAAALAAGGFLLHSAGVKRGDRAWLFFGPSGAGKSTTASNAPADAEVLGDDLVLVEPRADGWHACGVPFRGTFVRGFNASSTARIAMALRLVQSKEVGLEETRFSIQVAELLGEVPFLFDDSGMRERAAATIERFAREVPVRRLLLRRDAEYWTVLDP